MQRRPRGNAKQLANRGQYTNDGGALPGGGIFGRHHPPAPETRRYPNNRTAIGAYGDTLPFSRDAPAHLPDGQPINRQGMNHDRDPAWTDVGILRSRYCPSRSSPRNLPFSTTTLPRRMVIAGQAWTSWPSQGE